MKHLILVLGLTIIPTKQENLQPPPTHSTPYIHIKSPPRVLHQKPTMTLVDALIMVESSGNPNAHCKKERACGCLQIRPIMLREVNRILRKQNSNRRFLPEDRWDCGLSTIKTQVMRELLDVGMVGQEDLKKNKPNIIGLK